MWADEVDKAFAGDVDYAQLVKVYGIPNDGEKRYSPAQCLGCESHTVTGSPDPKHISTSYVERQNPHDAVSMRRFTRLTNAFSKKMENHMHAVGPRLHVLQLRSGPSDIKMHACHGRWPGKRKWEISDIVAMVEAYENSN